MRIYEASFNVLKKILKEKEPFNSALKIVNGKYKKDEISIIANLTGLFLRNYYAIKAISYVIFKIDDVEPLIYTGIVYANNSFKKYFDEKESVDFLVKKLALYQIKVDDEQKNKFKEATLSKKEYLAKNVKSKDYSTLSAITNIPDWIIKMLFKQYDKSMAFPVINSLVRMPKQFAVRLNAVEANQDGLKSYNKVEGDLFEYTSKTSIRKDALVRDIAMFPIQKAEYDMVKYLPALENSNILCYFEDKNAAFIALINKYLPNNKLTLATSNQKNYPDLFTRINKLALENLSIIESNEEDLIANISEKQDLCVYIPKSSNFELLRRNPEYGILFDNQTLDGIIAKQEEELNDIVGHLNVGGYLCYAVPTFDIKETLVQMKKFLDTHKNFSLVKEITSFPNEKGNSLYYFALVKKEK